MRAVGAIIVFAACGGMTPPPPQQPAAEPAAATAAEAEAGTGTEPEPPLCLPVTTLVDAYLDWSFHVAADGASARVCGGVDDDRICMDVDRRGEVRAAPAPAPAAERVRESGGLSVSDGTLEVRDGSKRIATAKVQAGHLDDDSTWRAEWLAGSVLVTASSTWGVDAELWTLSGAKLARVARMEDLKDWHEVAPGQFVTLDWGTELVVWDAATGAKLRSAMVQELVPADVEAIDPSVVRTISLDVYAGGFAVFAAGDYSKKLARVAFVDLPDGVPVLVDAPICAD